MTLIPINEMKFVDFADKFKNLDEGIVLLGCGGDLREWLLGFSEELKEAGMTETADPKLLWKNAVKLVTTGGRTDLALIFSAESRFEMSKLALWKLQYEGSSWVSDYISNYANQHEA